MDIPDSDLSEPLPANHTASQHNVQRGTVIALHIALDTHEPRTGYRVEFDDRTPRYGQYGMVLDPEPEPQSPLNTPQTIRQRATT